MRDDEVFALTFFGIIIVAVLVFFVISLVIQIFFLLTLHRCLDRVKPENREMEPGMVWLNLIPIFSMGWIFYTIIKIKESLTKEYDSRELQGDGDFGFAMGLTYAICVCCSAIPYLGILIALASIVFWIIYWVKIVGYSNELDANPGYLEAELVE